MYMFSWTDTYWHRHSAHDPEVTEDAGTQKKKLVKAESNHKRCVSFAKKIISSSCKAKLNYFVLRSARKKTDSNISPPVVAESHKLQLINQSPMLVYWYKERFFINMLPSHQVN